MDRVLHSPNWAGGIATLATVDEELALDYDELVEYDHDEYEDDQDATWTEEMEREGVEAELKRLEHYGVYEVIDQADREQSGKLVTTAEVKKVKWVDGKKTCRVRFCGRDVKWLGPHVAGLFAPTTGCSTQRLVDFLAVKRGWPTLTAGVPAAFFHTPVGRPSQGRLPSRPPQR